MIPGESDQTGLFPYNYPRASVVASEVRDLDPQRVELAQS